MTEQDLLQWLSARHPGLQFLGGQGMYNAGNRKGPYSRENALMNHLYSSSDGGVTWQNTNISIDAWCRANDKTRLALEEQYFPPKKKEEPRSMPTEAEIRAKGRNLGAAFASLFQIKHGSTSGTAMQLGWEFAKYGNYQGDDLMAFALGFASVFDNHVATTALLGDVVE